MNILFIIIKEKAMGIELIFEAHHIFEYIDRWEVSFRFKLFYF